MEDVLADEPILIPKKNGRKQPAIFEQIKNRTAKTRQEPENIQYLQIGKMGQELENIQHYRARLVNSNESSEAPKSVQQKAIEKSQSSDILSKYIEFFGNVLKTVMTYDNQNFKKLVEQKIESSDLYYKLINLLNEENIDKIFLNNVAKVVYYSTTKSIVEAIVMGETGINIKHLVKKLHSKYMKYLSLTCHLLMKHWYHYRHDLAVAKNDAHHDIEHCEWLIKALKKEPTQGDCLYALYYIMDKMPMTTVKAVFQSNDLENILDKSIVGHQLRGDSDCELLALKVKLFIHNGNFLSEKLVRDSVMPSRSNGMGKYRGYHNGGSYNGRTSNGRNRRPQNRIVSNDPDLIPLDFEPAKKANYKGVLKSVTELKDAEPYAQQNAHYSDRRLEMFTEEENKIVEFTYGKVLHMSKILQKGYQIRYMSNCDHKYIVAGKICELLNSGSRGILLIGVGEASTIFEDTRIIEGVHMDRKTRDEFRIGLDNVLNDLITPTPKYQRFEPPVFNPVLEHPNIDLDEDEECVHFVIRLDIKPLSQECDEEEKDVKYKVKNTLLISKKKNKNI